MLGKFVKWFNSLPIEVIGFVFFILWVVASSVR
jgi:hypothetical protein